MSGKHDAPPASTAERTFVDRVADYRTQTFGVVAAELQKLRHDPFDLATRAVQPILWLVLFGNVMARARGLSGHGLPYLDFLSAGILAQSVLFASIFYGISAIWERDLGVLHRYLVSPAPRSALVIGKAVSASVRGVLQAAIIYVIALAMGVGIKFEFLATLGVIVLVALGAALFATLSLIIACLVKTRERFMGVGQLLTMPIFFASNAIYPLDLMPDWLKTISSANPLTYEVDGLRALMLNGGQSIYGIALDLAVLTGASAVLITIAARLYPKMAS